MQRQQQPFHIPYLVSHMPKKSVSPPSREQHYMTQPFLKRPAPQRQELTNRWYLNNNKTLDKREIRENTRSLERLDKHNTSAYIQNKENRPRQVQQVPQYGQQYAATAVKAPQAQVPPQNEYYIQLQQQNKQLYDEVHTLKTEYMKAEKQRTSLSQNYSQLVQMYDQSQRDMFTLQQRFQQLTIDCQYNEQYKQKLHDFIEQQKHLIQKIQEEKPVELQTQILDLEQENHTLRHELQETKGSLAQLNSVLELQAQNQPQVQVAEPVSTEEKVISLTQELISQLEKLGQVQGYELLFKWRDAQSQKNEFLNVVGESETKRKYKEISRLMQGTTSMLSLRLKYKTDED